MTEATLSSRDVKHGLTTAVIGSRVRCFRSLSSTMDTARRMAEGGAPEGAVVLAERQTQGRGRFERPWVSTPGQNLSLSIILRPPLDRMRSLNMAASVALVEAIHATTGLIATVKWPNDVRVNGKKVAGLLIEARAPSDDVERCGYAILGVGLNVNHDPTPSLTPPAEATSLALALGRPVDRLRVLQAFLRSLDALYITKSGRGGALSAVEGAAGYVGTARPGGVGRRARSALGGLAGRGGRRRGRGPQRRPRAAPRRREHGDAERRRGHGGRGRRN